MSDGTIGNVKAMCRDDSYAPTAPLAEFREAYEDDDNWWWRILICRLRSVKRSAGTSAKPRRRRRAAMARYTNSYPSDIEMAEARSAETVEKYADAARADRPTLRSVMCEADPDCGRIDSRSSHP